MISSALDIKTLSITRDFCNSALSGQIIILFRSINGGATTVQCGSPRSKTVCVLFTNRFSLC